MQEQTEPNKSGSEASTEAQPSTSPENSHQDSDQASGTPLLEWLVGLLGLILVLGSVGFLLYQALFGDSNPPDIAVQLDTITSISNGYLVKFRAMNQGEATAKGVIIEGQLNDTTGEVETSEATLDYIPANSEREGGLFFTQDPRQFELQLRSLGYEQP
jgi:uncharacterized protein (TIGR02588 family)